MGEPPVNDALFALYAPLLARLRDRPLARHELSALVDDAVSVWSRPGFETFLSLAALRFEPFDYQVQAARVALRRMHGRAILADEVGLGKTIEAGLVLAELRLRGLADRTLVITPAGLVAQWREELERKFAVPTLTAAARQPADNGSTLDRPVLVASLAELDMILGRVDDDFDFESTVFDAFVASGDDDEFAQRMAAIGDDLARARTDYLATRRSVDDLVGDVSD